jgi:NTP pyrophosphatase (non-canonical NTP hydrolase)
MTPNEFQQLCLRTEKTPTFVDTIGALDKNGVLLDNRRIARIMHGMIGVCTEAGELQDMVKKFLIYGKPFDLTNVMEESFDILWYVALCLDAAGFTMEEAMERGIAKLRARFPDGFSEQAALNRDLDKERLELEKR